MRHLDDRKSTMMAGLSYAHFTQYGYLRTTLAGDTLDNSNGIVWDMAWLYRYTNGGLTVTPGIGVQWNSENQNEYYYGVSAKSPLAAVCVAITRRQLEPLPGAERQLQLPRRLECLRYRTLHPSV